MLGKINLKDLEQLARDNQWKQVEEGLRKMDRRYLLDDSIIHLAQMARRSYQLSLALFLLKPLVLNAHGDLNFTAKKRALSEFAVCQVMLGGKDIAHKILSQLNLDESEELFAWVTYHFSNMDYFQAIPYLESYIDKVDDPYKKAIGEINLCASLVFIEDFESAESRIKKLQEYLKQNNYQLLYANSLELLGQLYVKMELFDKAEPLLREAIKKMVDSPLYSLFVNKWLLVSEIAKGAVSESQILNFADQAKNLEHYQSVRESLFYWAYYSNNSKLLEKLEYGTPFFSYRQMMQRKAQGMSPVGHCSWNGQWFDHHWESQLRIESQPLTGLRLSKLEQSVLENLMADFFEPTKVGSLFYKVYPDEYFDPTYSVAKTYKLIQRLNRKLAKNGVGISIASSKQRYQLNFQNGWMIEKPHPNLKNQKTSDRELRLLSLYNGQPFSREELMQDFSLSKSSALRWLKELLNKGAVEKIGQGPGAFYVLQRLRKSVA